MIVRSLTVAIAAIAVPAMPLSAQMGQQNSPSTSMASEMTPSDYVKNAGAADLYEKESSKLLLQSTKDPQMRSMAKKMIADHTTSTNEVKAAAMQAGLQPESPALDATGRRNMAELRRVTGKARDRLYIAQQKKAHKTALELHRNYADNGTSPPLKAAAAKIAPVVARHSSIFTALPPV